MKHPWGKEIQDCSDKVSEVIIMTMPLKGTTFVIGLYSTNLKHPFSINHWSECINIWCVTSFGHKLIKGIYMAKTRWVIQAH